MVIPVPKPRRTVALPNYSEFEGDCRCGCGMAQDNDAMIIFQAFVFMLQRKYGCKVVHEETSGARCQKHNAAEGGASDSRHLHKDAFDSRFYKNIGGKRIRIPNREIAAAAIASGLFGGVGYMKYEKTGEDIVHLDCRPGALVQW